MIKPEINKSEKEFETDLKNVFECFTEAEKKMSKLENDIRKLDEKILNFMKENTSDKTENPNIEKKKTSQDM